MFTRVDLNVGAGLLAGLLAMPVHAARIVYVAEQDFLAVPELYIVDLDRPGESLKLNKSLPWFAQGVGSFAISPDGSMVAFAADQHIAPDAAAAVDADLYLVDITSPGSWVRLGGLPAGMIEAHARFSPDGSKIAFTASDEFYGSTQLYLVDLASPDSATLMNGPLADNGAVSLAGFAFTPDGSHLVYTADERDTRFELYAVALDRPGQSVQLNAAGGNVGDTYEGRFRILPDSKRIVYSAVWKNPGQRELHIVSLDAPGAPSTLNAPFAPGGYVYDFTVSPDGRHVAYVADAETDHVIEAYLVSTDLPGIAGKISGNVLNGAGLLEFTADGNYLLFAADGARGRDERDLYMFQVDGGTAAIRLSVPLGSGQGVSRYGVGPDGTQVVYPLISPGGFAEDLYVARTDAPGAGISVAGSFAGGAIEVFPSAQFDPAGEYVAFIAVEAVDSSIQELFFAAVAAPGTAARANGTLAPGGIVPPNPGAFRFLPENAPPTGSLPSEGEPATGGTRGDSSGDNGGGGSLAWQALLLLLALALHDRARPGGQGIRVTT